MSIDKQAEKNISKLKYLSGAVAGVGVVKVGQILIPKAVALTAGEIMFMGVLGVPKYFIGALLLGAMTPVYTTYVKAKQEKANRKAEEIKASECFTLED